MANKKTVPLSDEEYKEIITALREGFSYNGINVRPNNRVATILVIQANLGLRIGDVLSLRLNDIVWHGGEYKLNIYEQKTGKYRNFIVPIDIYNYIKMYCLENGIKPTAKIFEIKERAVQTALQHVSKYLGLERVSTHSFRKKFATDIYKNNGCDLELVRELLQHSSIDISKKYLEVSTERARQALIKNTKLL